MGLFNAFFLLNGHILFKLSVSFGVSIIRGHHINLLCDEEVLEDVGLRSLSF